MRLPQGPWFPWSGEFRWDRLPWQATTGRERQVRRDQQDLATLVEVAATTIGTIARSAGFVFRADASTVSACNGVREVSVLYEADAKALADRFPAMEEARGDPCADLWIYWSPDAGTLDLTGPAVAFGRPPHAEPIMDGAALRAGLERHAAVLAKTLGGTET